MTILLEKAVECALSTVPGCWIEPTSIITLACIYTHSAPICGEINHPWSGSRHLWCSFSFAGVSAPAGLVHPLRFDSVL